MAVTEKETNSALLVRVGLLEERSVHIETQVNAIRDTMATKADIASIGAEIQALINQQQQALKPNYSLLVSIVGVAMVFLTMIGGFAYWPINSATSDLKLAVIALADNKVSSKQYDSDAALSRLDRQTLRDQLNITIQQQRYNADMKVIDDRLNLLLPRAEFIERHVDLQRFIAQREDTNSLRFDALVRRLTRLEDTAMKR